MAVYSDDARAAWRAKREERRAKQRAQNIIRARKMHVARLEYEQDHISGAANAAPAASKTVTIPA